MAVGASLDRTSATEGECRPASPRRADALGDEARGPSRLLLVPGKAGGGRRELSAQAHLVLLVTAVLLPLALAAGLFLWCYAEVEDTRYKAATLDAARAIAADVDRELDGMTLALEALATSPALRAGDLAAFDAQARAVLRFRGRDVAMRDRTGQTLVNTRVPWGTPLPVTGSAEVRKTDAGVFATGEVRVSDLYQGTLARQPLLMVDVPVMRDGEVAYALNMTLAPDRLSALLASQAPTPGWVVGVVDRDDRIVARSRDLDRYLGAAPGADYLRHAVGQEAGWVGTALDGTPVIAAMARSRLSGWRVGVGVPRAVVEAPLRLALGVTAAAAVLALALAAGLAAWRGRALAGAIGSLAAAAAAVGRGAPVPRVATPVREVNLVGRELEAAAAARARAEARQRLLLGELNHRVKNTLAVIQGMARQTVSRAESVPEFVATFAARVRALAAAHDLLTETGWAGVGLAELVRRALEPHAAEDQAVVVVDDAVVPTSLAQDLALTLHELGTNAVKYGALSRPGGRVTVEGGVSEDGELRLVWRETGGSPVARPTRPGYGTLLLTQTIAYGRGGEVGLDWRREGLVCTVRVPLAVPRAGRGGDTSGAMAEADAD